MAAPLVGLIPAAGKGVRAYPYTRTVPKSMLEVDGVPLIERNVQLLRDQLDVRDIVVVVGYRGEIIRDHLGDGSRLGVRIRYVTNDRIELNLPYSLYVGSRELAGPCVVVLADECYIDSRHRDLLAPSLREAAVVCGVIESDSAKQIRKNYIPTIQGDRIVDLEEKPRVVHGSTMGTGTYLLSSKVLARLRAEFEPDPARGPRDWTSWLARLAHDGLPVLPFAVGGRYVNVNSRDDLNLANALARDATLGTRSASLVYLADDPDAVLPGPILEFAANPAILEVVIAARRPPPALASLTHPKVRVVTPTDPQLPTGRLVTLGLDAGRGDALVLYYSDGTFSPRDVDKLLVYLRDADLVLGTRTTRQMLEQGTNMRGIVRAVHVFLAKLAEIAWWRFDARFSDICCFYRAMWRSTYRAIRPQLTGPGVEILPEMVIEVLRARRRIIEIPVTYRNPDLGQPGVRSIYQTPAVFFAVLSILIRRRLADSGLGRRLPGARHATTASPDPARPVDPGGRTGKPAAEPVDVGR